MYQSVSLLYTVIVREAWITGFSIVVVPAFELCFINGDRFRSFDSGGKSS